jgi:hypothetical protein
MELKIDKEKSYYSTIGLMGFREFLISEQSETDTDRNTDRNRIQLTKKRILILIRPALRFYTSLSKSSFRFRRSSHRDRLVSRL